MLTESITITEAAILDTLRRRRIATPPDLAVIGRLTPNEVREAVQHLEEQKLVERFDSSFLRLTPAGDEVANENASRPVMCRPSTSVCTSCVPS